MSKLVKKILKEALMQDNQEVKDHLTMLWKKDLLDYGGEELIYFVMWFYEIDKDTACELLLELDLWDTREEMEETRDAVEGIVPKYYISDFVDRWSKMKNNMKAKQKISASASFKQDDIKKASLIIDGFMGTTDNQMTPEQFDFLSKFPGAVYNGEMYRVVYVESPRMDIEKLKSNLNKFVDGRRAGQIVSWSKSNSGVELYKRKYYQNDDGEDVEDMDPDELGDWSHDYSGHYAITIKQQGKGIDLLAVLKEIEKDPNANDYFPSNYIFNYLQDAENLEELAAVDSGNFTFVKAEYID